MKRTTKKGPVHAGFSTGLPSDYHSEQRILAPIPGLVTKVYVKKGEVVRPGDPLLVIEAMKMRNLIRSGHDLVVASVHVTRDQAVKAGDLLLEFKKQ